MRLLVDQDEMVQYIYSSILGDCDPEVIENVLEAELKYLKTKGIATERSGVKDKIWSIVRGVRRFQK